MHAVRQQLLILALAMVFIVLGLNRGLQPLLRLRNLVNARAPGALEPIQAQGMPAELAPLVDSINDYIRRLEEHATTQSAFVQNAAHQLRTPLALLNTQISFASRALDTAGRMESLTAARHTLQQTVRLVNQLLMLSAAEAFGGHAQDDGSTANDIAAVVQQVFESLAHPAQEKNIDLGFEAIGAPRALHVPPLALREILKNLIDNAIRYTHVNGVVTVRFQPSERGGCITVQDDGPGIPAEFRERVFERFFRIDDHDSNGSGLGLAIVREFASKVGAMVHITTPPDGVGLAVVVQFAPTPAGAP
jgi:two-component system sensor histidine kinase TctE